MLLDWNLLALLIKNQLFPHLVTLVVFPVKTYQPKKTLIYSEAVEVFKPVLQAPLPWTFCVSLIRHLIQLISSLVETARPELGVTESETYIQNVQGRGACRTGLKTTAIMLSKIAMHTSVEIIFKMLYTGRLHPKKYTIYHGLLRLPIHLIGSMTLSPLL